MSCLIFRCRWPVVAVLLAMVMPAAFAETTQSAEQAGSTDALDFARDVYPLLRRSCFECHGEKDQQAGLRLDLRDEAMDSGMLSPGYPEDSELLRRVTLSEGEDGVMPAVGDPLPPEQVDVLRRWIQQGATWPEDFEDKGHWAYRKPQKPSPPAVADTAWAQSPLDRFVLSRLEKEGLNPAPRAAPEKLVRRLFLDLIGLPPSPEEVRAFVSDRSVDRLERLVDDLLSRPQFGERWARPWLDLARYADSHGFQRDNLREIWAYRDWVIRALNTDLPFDQFTIEQLAGDLLPNATEAQKIATGFHRATPTNVEAGSLPEETRAEQLIDRVNTTGAVWLGTTLECCQCHDHKYDPFSAEDYYQLLAYFNSTEREANRTNPNKPSSIQFQGPSMPLSNPERDTRRTAVQAELDVEMSELRKRRRELSEGLEEWIASFRVRENEMPETHPLEVTSFMSQGRHDSFKKLDDESILLVGDRPPETDFYKVSVRVDREVITAFRVDVLQHDELPGRGPGRGDSKRTNFVLNEFTATLPAASAEIPSRAIDFNSATASFSQKNFDVVKSIDGDPETGWAISPKLHRPHWAQFVPSEPLQLKPGSEIEFSLSQQWGKARTIGRFRISAVTGNVGMLEIPEAVRELTSKASSGWTQQDRKTLVDYRVEQDEVARRIRKRIAAIEKKLKQLAPDTTLVMVELDEPRPTHVFERGDYRNPGKRVKPGTPDTLPAIEHLPGNRLGLAQWLVSSENPLTARVTVNRWWAELFGRGIVTTPEDFGVKGDPPTHPQLLDWLATEFVDSGWSMKHVLRTIVLSATYQQSSIPTAEKRKIDDQNELLARGPRFRMTAEMIRDNALAISGLIDLKAFGPPIRPYQPEGIWSKVGGTAYDYQVSPGGDQHRRGVYVVLKRGSPYPSFINFDATPRLTCTVKRSRTNTPLQALTLLNDRVYVESAKALGKRVRREKPAASLEQQLRYAFQLCTARQPKASELTMLRELYEQQLTGHAEGDAVKAKARERAWESIATVLLNLHETITND